MLVFIIPVKSKKIANSWERVSKLVERCLKSACNQTSPIFRAVVVCNEKPDIQFQHPHIHYVEVDFPPPIYKPTEKEVLESYDYNAFSPELEMRNANKARKILAVTN